MKILFMITAIFLGHAFGQEVSKVYVHSFDKKIDLLILKSDVYEKHIKTQSITSHTNELPSTKSLNTLFIDAQLSKETKAMDQVSKDIFVMKVSHRSIAQVTRDYPNISPDKLKVFKQMLEAKK